MANWPIGTVVQATCVIIDYNEEVPRIVARPGELGIVFEHCDPQHNETHEVLFSGGCFTSSDWDPAVKLYVGAVSTVCDGQGGHPAQLDLYARMVRAAEYTKKEE